MLSSIITQRNGSADSGFCLITGGNDEHIKVYSIGLLNPKLFLNKQGKLDLGGFPTEVTHPSY